MENHFFLPHLQKEFFCEKQFSSSCSAFCGLPDPLVFLHRPWIHSKYTSRTGTVRCKPVLPRHAEQIEFMSLHMIVPLICPMAELPRFPNTMSWTATNVILHVLEIWPCSSQSRVLVQWYCQWEQLCDHERSRGEEGRGITGMQKGLSLSNSFHSHYASLQFCISLKIFWEYYYPVNFVSWMSSGPWLCT